MVFPLQRQQVDKPQRGGWVALSRGENAGQAALKQAGWSRCFYSMALYKERRWRSPLVRSAECPGLKFREAFSWLMENQRRRRHYSERGFWGLAESHLRASPSGAGSE